jgi:formylglycine-generating enzyme required for sulfatase activity
MNYGDLDTDFSQFANMADASSTKLVVEGVNPQPVANPGRHADYLPKDARFDDGHRTVAHVGAFRPNAWGLHDMHGNVAEWTRSIYRAYPCVDDDRHAEDSDGERVVRGGSWRDRPKRCRSAFRLQYPPWQPVFNVGFRIVCPVDTAVSSR